MPTYRVLIEGEFGSVVRTVQAPNEDHASRQAMEAVEARHPEERLWVSDVHEVKFGRAESAGDRSVSVPREAVD